MQVANILHVGWLAPITKWLQWKEPLPMKLKKFAIGVGSSVLLLLHSLLVLFTVPCKGAIENYFHK